MSSSFKSEPPTCCLTASSSSTVPLTQLKLYQAFIFSVPIFFALVLLFLFYLFYLRRRRVDWASLRMRASSLPDNNGVFRPAAEMGLKKELREMLPIIVYKESFSVRDTQCPVCLGDYQAEDRLQQIPACGHTFHMDCIDHWLANHSTCPLCRLSLLVSAKAPSESSNQEEIGLESSVAVDVGDSSVQPRHQVCEEFEAGQELRNGDCRTVRNNDEDERRSDCGIEGREFRDYATDEERDNNGSSSV